MNNAAISDKQEVFGTMMNLSETFGRDATLKEIQNETHLDPKLVEEIWTAFMTDPS